MRDVAALMGVLAHRYPFLLVDRILEVDAGRVRGLRRVTADEWCCVAGREGTSAMPGLLVVEALAQLSGAMLLTLAGDGEPVIGYFAGIDRVRLRRAACPGDELLLEVSTVRARRGVHRLAGRATVDGELVASAEFTVVVRRREAA